MIRSIISASARDYFAENIYLFHYRWMFVYKTLLLWMRTMRRLSMSAFCMFLDVHCRVKSCYFTKTLKSSHYSTPLRLYEVPSRGAFQFCSWVIVLIIILSLRSLHLQHQHVWTQNRDQPEVQLLCKLVHFFSMRMSENTPSIRHFDTILVSSPSTFDL